MRMESSSSTVVCLHVRFRRGAWVRERPLIFVGGWEPLSFRVRRDGAEGESVNRLGRSDSWDDSTLSGNLQEGWARSDHFAVLRSNPLDSARIHGYRVGLPRDSITDP